MINAGVSLVRAMSVLAIQTENPRLKETIMDVQARVEAGETLSRAMMYHSNIFNNLFIGLVRAGEVGGVLDETLDRLAQFLEADLKLRQKIKAAMTYPVLVMVVAFLIVTGLVVFIVPKFIEIFKDFKIEMPVITQILINISEFTTSKQGAIILLGGGFGSQIAWRKFKSTKFGKPRLRQIQDESADFRQIVAQHRRRALHAHVGHVAQFGRADFAGDGNRRGRHRQRNFHRRDYESARACA